MMEEQGLPSIRDMYNCTRQNHDYNVIRKYTALDKNFAVGGKPTKKDHYLDKEIKNNCSPGPATQANHQNSWNPKNAFQSRRAEKHTYLDEITIQEKKRNSPAANHYAIAMNWPKKQEQLKHVSDKSNFADTCQYDSDKLPGPGTYNISSHLGYIKNETKKSEPHLPIRPKEVNSAEVGTYSPCPIQYNTFDRSLLKKSQTQVGLDKKPRQKDNNRKENRSPGPAAYSTINHWEGKSPKKTEASLFRCLSRGPMTGVYH